MNNSIIVEDIFSIVENNSIDWNKLNHKTVLITGGTGMLASYIVYSLIILNETKRNYNVRIVLLVRNIEKCKEKFKDYCEKEYFHIIYSNLSDEIRIPFKIDYIIHAASLAVTQLFSTNPIEVMFPNSIGLYNLLELGVKNEIEGFLFFSAGAIYGKMDKDFSEEMYGPLDPLAIGACYSESKRFGESLCMAYYREKNVPVKIVRIAHTYGPTLDLVNDKRVFADFIKNIINNEDIIMKSDGLSIRCFCYITDATDAFFRILLHGNSGEAYNMANNDGKLSIYELAKTLVNLFPEKQLKIIKQSRNENDTYIENNNFKDYCFINDKLKKLGWVPKVGVKEGFIRTIKSIQENSNEAKH